MPRQNFELYLVEDPAAQQRCLNAIQRKFGVEPKRMYKNSTSDLRNFYDISLIEEGNIWDTARMISSINGVLVVDPLVKLLGQYNIWEDNDDFTQDRRWNHKLTHFDEAIEASIRQGKLNPNVGTSIRIVQLDTGYTGHPEIKNVDLANGRNYIKGEEKTNPLDTLRKHFLDQPGHGTSTASVLIGGVTDQSGDVNTGVFPYIKLIPYRISPSVVHITRNTIAEAVVDAVDSGCDIITMSMGGAPPRKSWESAAQYAFSKGVIFVCAAGNYVKFVVWPARYRQVIAVAGVNFQGLPWEGSSYGKEVVISAPAENVYVARTPEAGKYLYTNGNGTSFATPHVAAAAALWLNHYRTELNSPHFTNRPEEKVKAFRHALTNSADVPENWTEREKSKYGAGILNARRLLDIPPNDYLETMREWGPRRLAVTFEDMQEEKSPSLLEKELLHLILNNNAANETELNSFVEKNGSAKAVSAFKVMQTRQERVRAAHPAAWRTLMDLAAPRDEERTNAWKGKMKTIKSSYLDDLAGKW